MMDALFNTTTPKEQAENRRKYRYNINSEKN